MRCAIITGLALNLVSCFSFAIVQAQETRTIAISLPAADHGWASGVIFQAQQEAKVLEQRHPGLKFLIKTSPDSSTQANAVEDLAMQGLDALITLPINSDEITDSIRHVRAKGVFISIVDRALRDPIQDLYVSGNNPELGRVAAAFMMTHLDAKGDIVIIRGMPILIDEQRVDAFNAIIKNSRINVIDSQYGNWSSDDAFKVMQDFLTKHPKIDAVWCQDDDMASGALEAIKQSGRTDIKFVVGGAGMKEMIKRVMDGDEMVPVDIAYPPAMLAVAMDLTVANFYDKLPVRGTYILNASLITKANAKNYYYPDSPY